jgi:TIR domain
MDEYDYDYDLFVSHASEDKHGFVRHLVGALEQRGLRVWFDEAELQVGDNLVESIDHGLRRSRFAVVVLSRAFFAKRWPRAELDALANREISSGDRVLLPIWLNLGEVDVREYSPLLAGKLALRSDEGVEAIADQLGRRVRGEAPAPPASTALEPLLLRGRILPSTYGTLVRSDERALVSRAALAARVATAPEPSLRPATQQLFEDRVATSSLEGLLHELTSPLPRPDPEHYWRLVEPTKSWIITALRPAAAMIVEGWTAEGRAVVSLKHTPSVAPIGWLMLHLDVAIRPLMEAPAPGEREWIPLSLDDLFALVYVPLSSLLAEVAPAVVPSITGEPEKILAVGCLVMPNGDPFSRYVRFANYARRRVDGATDAYAIDWYPASLDEIATPEARANAIRERIEGLFVDGGYRGFEAAVERLEAPAVPPPMDA